MLHGWREENIHRGGMTTVFCMATVATAAEHQATTWTLAAWPSKAAIGPCMAQIGPCMAAVGPSITTEAKWPWTLLSAMQ